MREQPRTPSATTDDPQAVSRDTSDALPAYEPPRLVKKRSVARATLLTGSGPSSAALVMQG